MLYTPEEPIPSPTVTKPNPAYDEEVDRRATRLCVDAEPHADNIPCVLHRSEARRQTFDLYQRQNDPADMSARTL